MKTHSRCGCLLGVLMLVAVSAAVYAIGAYPWMSRWGATDAEMVRALPGDDLAAAPSYRITRALSVQAPPEQIWPHLVALAGARGQLAARVMPPGYFVTAGQGFVIMSTDEGISLTGCFGPPQAAAPCAAVWQLALQPENESSTRVILRSRTWAPDIWSAALSKAFQLPAFLLERDLLLDLKALVEP